MFNISISYDPEYFSSHETSPVKQDILSGMNLGELWEKYDDFGLCDCAVVSCAIDLGWNLDLFIKEEIEPMLSETFYYDETSHSSAPIVLIVSEAQSYIDSHLATLNAPKSYS